MEELVKKGYLLYYMHYLLAFNGHMGVIIHNPLIPEYSERLIENNKNAYRLACITYYEKAH